MLRHHSFRRFVIATTLFLGLFTQFQTVFACEFNDGKLQIVCCCDTAGDMSMGCDMGGGCNGSAGPASSSTMNCCETAYQPAPTATAIAPDQHVQQVLLLDAPQPPPIPASFDLKTHPASSQTANFLSHAPPRVTGTQTYLLTNRFRI
ncbi:MAG TPA: hypothetical protein ENK04_09390 [Gammaproteobacteria bacterium]|nr:hypothetical protein [Gammaproteobacteria bacterium]